MAIHYESQETDLQGSRAFRWRSCTFCEPPNPFRECERESHTRWRACR